MKEERAMESPDQLLINLIDENTDELTRNWLRIVRNHQITRSYGAFDETELYERCHRVFKQLSRWLAGNFTKGDIASYYTALGAQRRREGFPLAEVVRALIVTRRVLWFKVQAEGFLDTPLDVDLALLLNNRVVLFFDRALYFTVAGYERK
jgi:hypothetical protein